MEEFKKNENNSNIPYLIIIIGLIAALFILLNKNQNTSSQTNPISQAASTTNQISTLEESVIPSDGIVLPVTWGNLGVELSGMGVIDADKMKAIYSRRGQFTDEYNKLLFGSSTDKIKITPSNAGYLLNLFWALGLSNKNPILTSGEMVNPAYGGAKNFASTAGWTISKGNPMDYYSKFMFVKLTPDQQVLVDKISQGIYRPCCGNSTHFPDCNHGMAMLGLLELMASQGVSEQDMWKTALAVNSYWFPDTYITIATYMKNKGVEWKDINPQEMLSSSYSSGQGYAKIASMIATPSNSRSANGCSVDSGDVISAPVSTRQQSGCGI